MEDVEKRKWRTSTILDAQDKIKNFTEHLSLDKSAISRALLWPKISIVMPSLNQVEFIERSILSVLNQKYVNLELIIIDGGSTDGTLEILNKYNPYIFYWESKPDKGQSHALNKGFEHASGEIYGWLNADDLYMPDAFTKVANIFIKYPKKTIIFGDYYAIDQNDQVISLEYAFNFNYNHLFFEGLHLNAQSMFWKRSVHEGFGRFNENLHYTMDYDMILRFGLQEKRGNFYRLDIPLGCFRQQKNQKTRRFDFDKVAAKEYQLIAYKNNCSIKFTLLGKVLRYIYRGHTYRGGSIFWYVKRERA